MKGSDNNPLKSHDVNAAISARFTLFYNKAMENYFQEYAQNKSPQKL